MAAEKSTSNYLITDDSYKEFINISNFLKNATLKDSVTAESYENVNSKAFGDLMVKYYEKELSDVDIYNILNFTLGFNEAMNNAMRDKIISKVFGIGETIASGLLFEKLKNRVIELLTPKYDFQSYAYFYINDIKYVKTNVPTLKLSNLEFRLVYPIIEYKFGTRENAAPTATEKLLFTDIELNSSRFYKISGGDENIIFKLKSTYNNIVPQKNSLVTYINGKIMNTDSDLTVDDLAEDKIRYEYIQVPLEDIKLNTVYYYNNGTTYRETVFTEDKLPQETDVCYTRNERYIVNFETDNKNYLLSLNAKTLTDSTSLKLFNIDSRSSILTASDLNKLGYIDVFVLNRINAYLNYKENGVYVNRNILGMPVSENNNTVLDNFEDSFLSDSYFKLHIKGEAGGSRPTNGYYTLTINDSKEVIYEYHDNEEFEGINQGYVYFTRETDGDSKKKYLNLNKVNIGYTSRKLGVFNVGSSELPINTGNIEWRVSFPSLGCSLSVGEFSYTPDDDYYPDFTKKEIFTPYTLTSTKLNYLGAIKTVEANSNNFDSLPIYETAYLDNEKKEANRYFYKFANFLDGSKLNVEEIDKIFLIESDSYVTAYQWQKDIRDLFLENSSAKENIGEYTRILLEKEKILISTYNNNSNIFESEKRCASVQEYKWTTENDLLSFIDVRVDISLDNPLYSKFEDLNTKYNLNFARETSKVVNQEGNTTLKVAYTILYKELNPYYRKLMNSYFVEAATEKLYIDNGNSAFFPNNSSEMSISPSIQSILRNIDISKNIIFDTNGSKLFKNFYAHPYRVRRALEDELIAFYYGDNIISNGFGIKKYEREEIRNFLDIYQETRDYFYRVLLNESFTSEKYYELFRKLYIGCFAIERFLSSKIYKLKEIDYFDDADISNFLQTYGLKVLDDLLKQHDFIDSEEYQKRLLHYFNDLVKNKGSKAVCDLLVKIFDFENTDIEIKKYVLAENTSFSDTEVLIPTEDTEIVEGKIYYDNNREEVTNPSGNPSENGYYEKITSKKVTPGFNTSLKFIESPYSTNNSVLDMISNIANAEDYESFISSDKYWNADVVKKEDLFELEINTTETKYLGLILKDNFYKNYLLSRLSFSLIDFLDKKFKSGSAETLSSNSEGITLDTIQIQDDDISSRPISLSTYSEGIKMLFAFLLKLYDMNAAHSGRSTPLPSKYFGINIEELEKFQNDNSELRNLISSFKIPLTNEYTDRLNVHRTDGKTIVDLDSEEDYIKFSLFDEAKDKDTTSLLNSGINVYNYLEGLNYLLSDGEQFTNFFIKRNPVLGTELDRSGELDVTTFEAIYTMIMLLPVNWIDGVLTPLIPEDNNIMTRFISKEFRDLVETMIDKVYIVDKDPVEDSLVRYDIVDKANHNNVLEEDAIIAAKNGDSVDFYNFITLQDTDYKDVIGYNYVGGNNEEFNIIGDTTVKRLYKFFVSSDIQEEELDKIIEIVSNRLISLINVLHDVFSSYEYLNWSISISESESNQLSFLKETINIFLSYTTQLYITKYLKSYDTESESIPFAESIRTKISQMRIDSFYYDEKLKIKKNN